MTVVALAMASAICVMSRTEKSSSRSGAMWRASRRMSSHARLHHRGRRLVVGRDVDGVDVAVAGDAALEGVQRHHHDIVLVLAEAGKALGLEQADDAAGHLADADRRALGIAGAEELLAHRLADQADAGAVAHLRTR